MPVIKLWWSVFSPKHKEKFLDKKYLKNFSKKINNIFSQSKIILIHWTWNFWHWFVKKYWLNKDNYNELKQILNWFFEEINKLFPNFKRIKAEDIVKNNYKTFTKTIIWWDIYINKKNEINIISSDKIFAKILKTEKQIDAYMLTDVNWVMQNNWEIINQISYENYNKTHFWEKDNDVTWNMQKKINHILSTWKKTYILNWKNLENFENVVKKNLWIFTKIN